MARGRAYGLCNMTKCLGQISFPRIPFPGYIQLGKAMRETLVWLMQGRSGATTHTYCLSPRPPECHKATTNATLHKLGTLLQLLWLLDQLCKFKQLRKRPASAETTPPPIKVRGNENILGFRLSPWVPSYSCSPQFTSFLPSQVPALWISRCNNNTLQRLAEKPPLLCETKSL